jgi:phosphoribosylaminoimidazole-succinocarboxamide synthase
MKKGHILYEGKAKKVFKTNEDGLYIIEYKDDATAFNGQKKASISGKGILNSKISSHFFSLLTDKGIRNHFVRTLSEKEILVKGVEIFPLEVIIRNIAAGSLAKRLGLDEGTTLKTTVLELCYKKDDLGDPLINDYHALALDIASKNELETIKGLALKINKTLSEYLLERQLILVDIKLEFGKANGEIFLADEISPDTCRFWDVNTKEKLDKDRFRRDLGNVIEGYEEVWNRLKGENENV